MSKELVIGSNRHETKVAILEDDQLAEIYFQRGNEYSLAGSIHKGRVTRVLPGMQSAFVDLGLERDTFLYVSDFFEENEDIDTVAEDKPGPGERRDRGQPRPIERVPVAVQEVEPMAPVVAVAPEVFEAPARFEAPGREEVAAPVATAAAKPESSETKTERPPAGDRGFRGDKRGRRSRRRRSRGRGFPENKYAQPGAGGFAAREAPSSTVEPAGSEEADEQGDVIILPGESLAKYRRAATSGEPEPDAREEEFESAEDNVDLNPDLEDEAVRDEELEAEAQEIELVDKILSHHDEESVIEEEEKIEEVRNDLPPSPFVVTDIEVEEEAERDAGEEARGRSSEARPSAIESPVAFAFEQQVPVEFESTLTVREGVNQFDPAVVTFPVEVPSSGESSRTEPASEEESFVVEVITSSEFEEADYENLDAGSARVEGAGELNADPPAGTVQTAAVRDQGDRYMHRVSRRMRRRRGGNRFSQQPGESSAAAQPGPAAGAATALAQVQPPEQKTDLRREVSEERSGERPASSERPERVMPSIAELLKPGQEIIVQIAKEPLGQKGARITSHIALPGRYVVFMPSVTHLGVSRKIESDEERQRLKRILQAHRPGTTGGFIVRTAGEGIPEDEIAADMDFLYKLWLDIRQKAEKKPAPALLHYDLDIVQRIMRDQVTDEFKAIWVDSEEMYENVLSFTQRFQPAVVSRVKMYTRSAPIFDAFGITQELEKALRPKVWLKSGGYIVINQTEALVAIDINTGKYVGKSNRLEDTIVKTNIEAVKEIVRQIRLRDLGGIIVVDFIDMDERKNRQKVMQALEEAMHSDRAPYKVLQFNDFGLVAITRKRVKQSLERTLCAPCPYCEGAGYVKSVQTVIGEILIEAQKIARALEGKDVLLRVHPEVAKVLKGNDNHYLEELEGILGRPVLVKGDPALHHEKFDLG